MSEDVVKESTDTGNILTVFEFAVFLAWRGVRSTVAEGPGTVVEEEPAETHGEASGVDS